MKLHHAADGPKRPRICRRFLDTREWAEEEEEVEEEKEPGDQEHFKSMCPSYMEKTSLKIMLYASLWCPRGCACVPLWQMASRLMCVREQGAELRGMCASRVEQVCSIRTTNSTTLRERA